MERPLLRVATPAVAGQRDDPQIAIGALRRISVDDRETSHRSIPSVATIFEVSVNIRLDLRARLP